MSTIGSSNPVFKMGYPLAEQQDRIFKAYESGKITCSRAFEIARELRRNLWVPAASRLAPCNLAIRQYCLIDILEGHHSHWSHINRLLRLLAPEASVWLEGYSYWIYTKPFLILYAKQVRDRSINLGLEAVIVNIDLNFQKTAYLRNGILFPAPFGDLRDIPLEDHLQNPAAIQEVSAAYPVYKSSHLYTIMGHTLGFNLHTKSETCSYIIRGKKPVNFKWYTGYDQKYRGFLSEFKDMIRFKRFVSAVKLVFKK